MPCKRTAAYTRFLKPRREACEVDRFLLVSQRHGLVLDFFLDVGGDIDTIHLPFQRLGSEEGGRGVYIFLTLPTQLLGV